MIYHLHQLLAGSARRAPDATALVQGSESVTYRQLDEDSSRLATWLRATGLVPGDRVAFCLPKSFASVTCAFGIMKAGGVYVPIDAHGPAPRASYILRDCGVRCLVTTSRWLAALGELGDALPETVVTVDEPPGADGPAGRRVSWAAIVSEATPLGEPHRGVASDLAYILYTSGSTGVPKGVMISHQAALTFVEWAARCFALTPEDVLSSHAPFHFDLSIFDLYAAAAVGAAVVLLPERLSTFPVKLTEAVRTHGITVWYSVPSALVLMLTRGRFAEADLTTLRTVLFAGEVFPLKYLRMLREATPARLFNLYGPTETNVCTYHEVTELPPDDEGAIPIGVAVDNYDVFALDDRGRRIAAGETGELLARGPGLMTGYWGDRAKTDAVLVQNPLQPHFAELVCRTGDLVRRDEEGRFLYMGRKDHMVKVRGYRVELGEVESALYRHPGVREAAVIVDRGADGLDRLKAFVVAAPEGELAATDVQSFCSGRLPKYMVPEVVEFRDELPKTSTGKVNRPALAAASG